MLSLFIFFSVYFTAPRNDILDFHKTTCENQSQYFLYTDFDILLNRFDSKIVDDEDNVVFSGILSSRELFEVKKMYCIENKIYLLLAESKENNQILNEFNIYKLDNEILTEQDSIEYVHGYNPILNGFNLIYNKYDNDYFYKTRVATVFEDTQELFHSPNYLYSQKAFYFENTESVLYVNKDTKKIKLQNSSSTTTPLLYNIINLLDVLEYDNKKYFLFETEAKKVIIIDEDENIYDEYILNDGEYLKSGLLTINEYGVYALILLTNEELRVISSPRFDMSKSIVKELENKVVKLYKDNDEIFYLKNNTSNTDIRLIDAQCTKPNSPVVGDELIGVHSEKPSSFTISNFNEDNICFVSYQFDVSGNERFTSVYYGENVTYYNQNSSFQTYQFYNNFAFEDNKPYYIRIKYDNILGGSDYTYIRLIITDLGEITSFEILDTSSSSKLYTNEEMVNIKLEKSVDVSKIQLSQNENFKDENNEDIPALDYNNNFNFLLPEEEKEYTYYVRPVIIDSSNNNIMGGNQAKSTKIILDKTAPSKPIIKTLDKTFFNDNIKIEWELSSDNLSGIESYKIRVVDALSNDIDTLSKTNTDDFYTPNDLLENGIYTFFISSCDNAENCSTESKTNFTVEEKENIKPYKPSLIRPKNKDVIDAMPLNISWTKSEDPEGDEVTYSLIIAKDSDFSQIEYEGNLINNLSTEITYLSQGHYYLKLYAVDTYGNNSDNELIEFDVIEPSDKTNSSSGCSF